MMSDTTTLSALLVSLDIAAFTYRDDGSCRVVGTLPDWFTRLYPDAMQTQDEMHIALTSPFLENFLVDALAFWQSRAPERLQSGSWREVDPAGRHCALEATAACVEDLNILCIERLGAAYDATQAILQQARENRLAYHQLIRAEEALRTSHDDVLAILNNLALGTVMLNEEGYITFLSQASQNMFGKASADLLGRHWDAVTPFAPDVNAAMSAMATRPPHKRSRVPVHLETESGRHYWMEIDIQDDPRDTRRRILCLYDMTEVHDLRRLLDAQHSFHDFIGKSEPMLHVYQQIRDVAAVDATVLIEGETGTGKELVARAIHTSGHRKDKPFIAVNSAGLTESLLASQLFGHKRGAFTGAVSDQQGFFEAAHGGTLFLDEIGDIPLPVQTSLLRVLQEREIIRLGDSRPRKVDVRILTATQHNLQAEVDKGTFRADVLYRIRVARIHLPPLRQRRQDIPPLVSAFLAHGRAVMGKLVQDVSHEAMRYLLDHPWPGNVRELKSAIEYAVIHCKGSVILVEDLPPELSEHVLPEMDQTTTPLNEKQRVLSALEHAQGNRTVAAQLLGISRATLYRRLASFDLP